MTEDNNRSTYLRRRLGAKLRRMREDAGLTLKEAAPLLDKKRSALQRIESGETRADVHLVRTLMDEYNQYDPDLVDEVREANKTPWYTAYGIKNAAYFDVEAVACQISQFLVIDLPGLLQTPAYMRALFSARPHWVELEPSMKARMCRQKRLTSEEWPLQLHTIVCEAALRRKLGPPELMREQLRHLIKMSELPTVTLQVMLTAGDCYVPNAPITVLTFPNPEDPPYLYVEHPTGSLQTEDPAQVEEANLILGQLRINALNPTDSVAFIEELLRTQQ
ncbi:helix-turn-helix domain-containing protein [Kibdelosporangium phytohabitans]|uniref:HTH cro/C1-type domain-containing protein n=1 Tax=Kibdelosporangium phytohabitans TaxID=860235 RepID=A0A0N9HS48_9PSEU|nr:helix-turn-helix transcriptional regulator [Kibdelosporangium phytohabitans]ALG07747.1 hypothetical protein AOZ06_13265 [Kibdelosporangium phytohabitans]MBE1471343.1 transcriptional regulator with XRE-family HTH domain [Kibdelosporangium phytohabitans]